MAALDLDPFPLSSSRVPDAETQAKSFLTKYPEADGRGIVVAILDTGCDPGAPGLQTTPQGLPKIVDCVDCTGSGDVDTTTVVKSENGVVTNPHTGRQLKFGSGDAWANPTGNWHVGMKQALQLYPDTLIKRYKDEKRAAWDETQRGHVAEARRKLAVFDQANPKPEGDKVFERKDLEDTVSQLEALQKDFDDVGIVMDVVAWHDGKVWRAAIDCRGDGDLSNAPALANFAIEQQWASMGELEKMNYCLNIYDEGTVVSIVCNCSPHGTHVAGITAAYHPDEPGRNGVAPGAQIVAVKIADTRLDAMETGMGMGRAFAHCMKSKVNLINMSFGEAGSPAGAGRLLELIKRAVSQHGIIFVTSAGNDGPALSTLGAPGNGSDTFVTIGAHVSPPAMEAQYHMLEKVPATPYTWTSRGPSQDGSLSVTVCAPGSAITSIPNDLLAGAQLMNGTSMASPNACGCVALVLSGLKAAGISWSPASVRRALIASALSLPGADPFAVGAGMIQVEKSYEYLVANDKLPYRDVTVAASVFGRGRGVYLREPNVLKSMQVFAINVLPKFKELDPSLNEAKINLELNVAVTSSASWVQVPPFVVITSEGRNFNIRVDPTGLPEGAVHLAHVCGFDTARPELGAIFRVPVTVVKAVEPTLCPKLQAAPIVKRAGIQFIPGHIERNFIAVPAGCTWAEVTVTAKPFDGGLRLFVLHLLQDLPHEPYSKTSIDPYLQFRTAGSMKKTFRVEALGTLEVTLGQFWSSLGSTEMDIEVAFHGVSPEATTVTLSTGYPVACVNALVGPGVTEVKPTASYVGHRTAVRPTSTMLQPCGERDNYPEGKQLYELVLEYPLKLDEDGDITPQALILNDKLYESIYEGQMIMIYDHAKRLVGISDAWPTPIKLKKGDYVAKMQVRTDNTAALEKLKTLALCFDRKLDKEIKVKAYPDYNSAIAASGEFPTAKLKSGTRSAVFFALPVDEKLPDSVKPGDTLFGPMSFGEPAPGAAGKKSRGGFSIQYAVMAGKVQEKKEEEKDIRTNAEKLADAIRDTQLKHLETIRKWPTREEHSALLSELMSSSPKHIPFLQEQIQSAEIQNPDADAAAKEEPARLQRIIDSIDALVASVDQDALAAHLGRRMDGNDAEAVRKGKEWNKAKDALVDALCKKIVTLEKQGSQDLTTTFKLLSSWVDVTEAKHGRTVAAYERASGRLGSALSALNKFINDQKAVGRELLEERASLLEKMGLHSWAAHERKTLIVKFPSLYSRF